MKRVLLITYLTLTAFVLLILEIPLGVTFANHERHTLAAEVERDAFVLASSAEDVLEGLGGVDLKALASEYQGRTSARVVIVDLHGIAVADSAPQTPNERDFSTRPEIKRALGGDVASGVRYSSTLEANLLFVAVPVASGGVVHGVVRITFPMAAVDARIRRNWLSLGLVALVALAAAAAVGLRLASSVARPLRSLEDSTHSIAQGQLAARAATGLGPPEVRAVARAFNDMAARLEELVSAQSEFVADASHQLRTPLTALRLRIENLEEAASGSLRLEAEAAGKELWRLQRIVDGLLALARAEGARPARQLEDVSAVIAARAEAWRPLADERGVILDADEQDRMTAIAVPGALEQIVDNLLANAIEASPTGGRVLLAARADDGHVAVHVSDEGPGMGDEERARAFDRFWRGPDNGQGGSGLGLAIVRQLARASGGDVVLQRSVAGGLEAIVRLAAS